jgi:hypothetical protein
MQHAQLSPAAPSGTGLRTWKVLVSRPASGSDPALVCRMVLRRLFARARESGTVIA